MVDEKKDTSKPAETPKVEEPEVKEKPRLKPIIEYRNCQKIIVGYIDIDTGKKSVVKASKKK